MMFDKILLHREKIVSVEARIDHLRAGIELLTMAIKIRQTLADYCLGNGLATDAAKILLLTIDLRAEIRVRRQATMETRNSSNRSRHLKMGAETRTMTAIEIQFCSDPPIVVFRCTGIADN